MISVKVDEKYEDLPILDVEAVGLVITPEGALVRVGCFAAAVAKLLTDLERVSLLAAAAVKKSINGEKSHTNGN